MLEASQGAREALSGSHLRWVPLERADEQVGELPDPRVEVPDRDPDELGDHPVADAYREMFWSLDVDPTKQRPAGEALARRVAQGKRLPRVLPLVDAYNLASAVTLVPISAFDREALTGTLELGLADGGEAFDPIGGGERTLDPGRPVLRDDEGVVSLLAYRDAERTALDKTSDEAVLVAWGPPIAGPRVLPDAIRTVESYVSVVGWRFTASPSVAKL